METTNTSPLRHLDEHAEAQFHLYGPREIVSTSGRPQAEYAATHKSCGMVDVPQRAVLNSLARTALPSSIFGSTRGLS